MNATERKAYVAPKLDELGDLVRDTLGVSGLPPIEAVTKQNFPARDF